MVQSQLNDHPKGNGQWPLEAGRGCLTQVKTIEKPPSGV